MKYFRNTTIAFAIWLGFAGAAWAQMGMGMRPPQIPGEFKPVVGSGAEYQITTKREPMMDMAIAIVGKESVEGADGYWTEMRMMSGRGSGTIMKHLMVMTGGSPGIKRMIVQPPGQPPMELPVGMMGMAGNMPKPQAGEHGPGGQGNGEMLGTESVTVPAGTFECQHYRSQSEHGTADLWVTTKVSPYGLVKMTSEDTSMVLQKVLTNETSQIKGEPRKMNFPGMPPH
jgi:hypothetical protein